METEERLLNDIEARLEAPVALEQDRIRYENARRLLGQRLANKLAHNVDTSTFLNRLSENPSDLSSMTGLR